MATVHSFCNGRIRTHQERFKAEVANEEPLTEFVKVSSNNGVIRILKESLDVHLRLSKSDKVQQKTRLGEEIEKAKARIAKLDG
jgi:hypothetical protein